MVDFSGLTLLSHWIVGQTIDYLFEGCEVVLKTCLFVYRTKEDPIFVVLSWLKFLMVGLTSLLIIIPSFHFVIGTYVMSHVYDLIRKYL